MMGPAPWCPREILPSLCWCPVVQEQLDNRDRGNIQPEVLGTRILVSQQCGTLLRGSLWQIFEDLGICLILRL